MSFSNSVLKCESQCEVVRRWGLWVVIGHGGGVLITQLGATSGGTDEVLLPLSHQVRGVEKMAVYNRKGVL